MKCRSWYGPQAKKLYKIYLAVGGLWTSLLPSTHAFCHLLAQVSFFTVTVYHIYSEHPGERPESNGRGDIWMEDKEQRQLDRRETCGVPALAGFCNPVRGKMFAAEWDLFMPDFENRRVHRWEGFHLCNCDNWNCRAHHRCHPVRNLL